MLKRSQLTMSKKKHRLFQMKENGEKDPIWKLGDEELSCIHRWGFDTKPWIFEIQTQTFNNPQNLPGVLKELHYAKRGGKKTICRKLKLDERATLMDFDIKFKVIKHRIFLHSDIEPNDENTD